MTSPTQWDIRHKTATFAQIKPEYIEQVCRELDKSMVQAGEDVYQVAIICEEHNNRGIVAAHIPERLRWVLSGDVQAETLRQDILFFAQGRRRGDWSGWGLKRRPDWRLVWGDRFGWGTDTGQVILLAMEVEAREVNAKIDKEIEAQKTKRKVETIGGQKAEEMTTLDVAYIAAVAGLLKLRYGRRYGERWGDWQTVLMWHYAQLADHARSWATGGIIRRRAAIRRRWRSGQIGRRRRNF